MSVQLAAEHGFQITTPELQERIQQERQRIQEERAEAMKLDQLKQFERYAEAVNAERYRVTSIKMRKDGTKQTFILDKRDGVTRGFTPEEIVADSENIMPNMVQEETPAGHIRSIQRGFAASQTLTVKSTALDKVKTAAAAIPDLLAWFVRHGADFDIKAAAANALKLYQDWMERHKPEVNEQLLLFGEEEVA